MPNARLEKPEDFLAEAERLERQATFEGPALRAYCLRESQWWLNEAARLELEQQAN